MKPWQLIQASVSAALIAAPFQFAAVPAAAEDDTVTISHYFTGDTRPEGHSGVLRGVQEARPVRRSSTARSATRISRPASLSAPPATACPTCSAIGRERAPSSSSTPASSPRSTTCGPPTSSTPWSPSRSPTAPRSTTASAIWCPFGYHYAGMFYNPKVMADAGITTMPKTWDDLLAACKTLKDKGVDPIALGSKNRWPAQFWFDYLLLRTAGPGLPRQADVGQSLLHRSRGEEGDGPVEGA